jgi:hypothetical protein
MSVQLFTPLARDGAMMSTMSTCFLCQLLGHFVIGRQNTTVFTFHAPAQAPEQLATTQQLQTSARLLWGIPREIHADNIKRENASTRHAVLHTLIADELLS